MYLWTYEGGFAKIYRTVQKRVDTLFVLITRKSHIRARHSKR